MQLYQLPYSHYSAKVRIVLLEKGIAADLPPIPGGSTDSNAYRQINPTGLVPCLVDGDLILGESEVIAEYLEEVAPQPPMLPEDPGLRAHSRWLSRLHDLYLAPQLSRLYGISLKGDAAIHESAGEIDRLHHWLALLEASIEPAPYFFGRQFCLSDASFCLSYWYALGLSAQFGQPLDPAIYPKTTQWFSSVEQRPSFRIVLADCRQTLGA